MSCSTDNLVHTSLYAFETETHDEIDVTFTEACGWGTDYLIGSAGDSADMRSQKAAAHADLMDQSLIADFGAKYKDNVDSGVAKARLKGVLDDSSKKLEDVAAVADSIYFFEA